MTITEFLDKLGPARTASRRRRDPAPVPRRAGAAGLVRHGHRQRDAGATSSRCCTSRWRCSTSHCRSAPRRWPVFTAMGPRRDRRAAAIARSATGRPDVFPRAGHRLLRHRAAGRAADVRAAGDDGGHDLGEGPLASARDDLPVVHRRRRALHPDRRAAVHLRRRIAVAGRRGQAHRRVRARTVRVSCPAVSA